MLTVWGDVVEPDVVGILETADGYASVGRIGDALTLIERAAETFVSAGDDDARRVISAAVEFCWELGRIPEWNERAIAVLSTTVEAAPQGATDHAVCQALTILSTLYTMDRTVGSNGWRTRAAIGVCEEIVRRWHDSPDPGLRLTAADAMLNKALRYMEIGAEREARQEYARVVATFAGNTGTELDIRVYIGRHAVDVLDTIGIPEPEFKTGYLSAMVRRANRDGIELHGQPPQDHVDQLIALARQLHHATANLVRRSACSGEPIVLLLRNFELAETSVVTAEQYTQVLRFTDGLPLVDQLGEHTTVVQVASTSAAALEIDSQGMSILGRPTRLRPLYLPDEGWLDMVRVLISVAERIVVWADEKTPGVLRELALLTELGRTSDTVVLLERHPGPIPELAAVGAMRKGQALTRDDPALAGFPVVMPAHDAPDFLRAVVEPVLALGRLPVVDTVARVRERIEAARQRR